MTRIFSMALTALLLLPFLGESTPVLAKDDIPIRIKLYPSAEPKPALKYKLLPSRIDQIAGNAAVYYGKVKSENGAIFSSKELWDSINRWQKMPLEELIAEKARAPGGGSIFFHLDRGARCRFCDWQLPIGDVQFYSILLPEIQESRQFSRMLAAGARIDIANKQYDKALHRFQTNYALGRHIAESECIVGGLVGVAICGIMNAQVMEFVQQPDTPNLYWALTTLPGPLVDMRKAVELELHGLELSYPEIRNFEGIGVRSYDSVLEKTWRIPLSRRTPEEWKTLYHAVMANIHSLSGCPDDIPLRSEKELEQNCQVAFPLVKKSLIVRAMQSGSLLDRGKHALEIEAMSMHQVVLLYMLQLYRDEVDDMAKYYGLSYPEAIKGFDAVAARYRKTAANVPEELRYASLGFGFKNAKVAETRLERQMAVLRVFEALRIYGASHGGKLPKHLSDITEVPIPIDPVTGKPFEYRLEDGTAHLQGPKLHAARVHYEITMDSR